MRFSTSEIDEIIRLIASRGVKDSDFSEATDVSGDDYVAIVQNGVNKKIKLRNFAGNKEPVGNIETAVTLPLLSSGSVYEHRMGKKPSVTVSARVPIEGGGIVYRELFVDVEYIDDNSLKIHYSPDKFDGWVYFV